MTKKELQTLFGDFDFKHKSLLEPYALIDGTKEEWRCVVGFENRYLVSNFGRVISILFGPRILSPTNERYPCVSLTGENKNGKIKTLIHRIVATAFIPNPEKKPCVNHIDGNPKNNNVKNLEWCTYSENTRHSFDILKNSPSYGMLGKRGWLCKRSKPIIRKNLNGKIIGVYSCSQEASRELNISQGTIWMVLNKKRKTMCHSTFHFISKKEYKKLIKKVVNKPIIIKRKLSVKDILDIRKMYDGSKNIGKKIGEKYGIDRTMALKIYNRKCWSGF